jgi:carbon-monoxide dehydrogenase medium subunit
MKAPPLSYVRAATLGEAFQLWRDAGPDARLLAGGQSLIAALAFRLSDPGRLIDITRLRELRGIAQTGTVIRVGALTTHAELGRHELMRQHVPLVAEAVPLIAHPAIRNRGTLGGSLALADPAAEYPACMVALDATIVIAGREGERLVRAEDFFKGLFEVDLRPGELVTAVEFVAMLKDERCVFLELARRHGDYAIIGLAAYKGATTRLVFFGAGATPVFVKQASRAATLDEAKRALNEELAPPADLYNSSATKLHLAKVLLERAWTTLSTSH